MVTRVIEVKVKDGDLNQLEGDLKKVDKQFKKVDQSANKASKSVDDVASNGGAIAILDSLTGGLATRIRDAYEASKLFNVSLKGMKTALIATGVGAFVVALGVIVAYWDDIVELVERTNKKLETQRTRLQEQTSIIDNQLKLNEAQQKLAIAQGKSTDKLVEKQKQLVALKLANLKAELEITKQQQEREKNQIKQVTFFEKLSGGAKVFLGLASAGEVAGDAVMGNEEERQSIIDRQNRILELETQIANLQTSQISSSNSGGSTIQRATVTSVSNLSPANMAKIEEAKLVADELIRINDIRANTEEVREKALANAKIGIAKNVLGIVGMIAEEGSALGKGVAVAQATIQGIEGVQNAYTTAQKSPITAVFPGYPLVQAGLAGAFSAVQIAKILSVDPRGNNTPNVSNVGGASGGGANVPSFNLVGSSQANQIIEGLQQDQNPIQAFVVGSNVTTQQELERNIVETASIG